MYSVVIPCYNCEKTIERCVNSFLQQSFSDIEIILVDDGSTDSTGLFCDKAAQSCGKIKVLHQQNKGLMNAWKTGVSAAEGSHILFCDADDYVDLDMLEKLAAIQTQYDADIILYGLIYEYANGQKVISDNCVKEGILEKQDIQEIILPHFFYYEKNDSYIVLLNRVTKMFKKELLSKNFELYDERVTWGEDTVVSFITMLEAKKIYCTRSFCPYHYVRNDMSMIGKYDEQMFRKLFLLRAVLLQIAKTYDYVFTDSIERDFASHMLVAIKKEICRNNKETKKEIVEKLSAICEDIVFTDALKKYMTKDIKFKIYSCLVKSRRYNMVYFMTKLLSNTGRYKD